MQLLVLESLRMREVGGVVNMSAEGCGGVVEEGWDVGACGLGDLGAEVGSSGVVGMEGRGVDGGGSWGGRWL